MIEKSCSRGLKAIVMILSIVFIITTAIFIIPANSVIAGENIPDVVITVGPNSNSNQATFTITCWDMSGSSDQFIIYSAWGWCSNNAYSVTATASGSTITVVVKAPEGKTFDSAVTVTVGASTSSSNPGREYARAGITYNTISTPVTPTNTAVPTKATVTNTPVPTTAVATNTPIPTTAVATNTPVPTQATVPDNTDYDTSETVATSTPVPTSTSATNTPTPIVAETDVTDETEETEPSETEETVILPVIAETTTESETSATDDSGEGTPTPTRKPTPTKQGTVAAGVIKAKDDTFPWWWILIALLLGLIAGRYYQLRRNGLNKSDILLEFIPGGVIRKVACKINPSGVSPVSAFAAKSAVTTPEKEPEVINGYLKTSNTKSIRPMYSNTPAARAAEVGAVVGSATTTNGLKAPIKRPTSASVNHAAVTNATKAAPAGAAAATATTTKATSTPAAKQAPVAPKAPIKRPTSASVNHAAVANATKAAPAGAVAATATTTKATSTPAAKQAPAAPKAPVKRPASASVNHAAVANATKAAPAGAVAATAKVKATPEEIVKAREEAAIAKQKAEEAREKVRLAREKAEAARLNAETAKANAAKYTANYNELTSASASTAKTASVDSMVVTGAAAATAAATTKASPFGTRGETKRAESSPSTPTRPAAPSAPARAASPAPRSSAKDTMNRPDSGALNTNATPTAAQEAFLKHQSEQKLAPAIATGFVPPVIDNSEPEDKPSPFKPISGVVENKHVSKVSPNVARQPVSAGKDPNYVPPIASFTKMPEIKKEASPFKPLDGAEDTNKSALEKIRAAKTAATHAGATDIDAVKAKEAEEKARKEAELHKAPTLRPGGANKSAFPAGAKKVENKPAATGSSSNSNYRPFNAAAAMKELHAMDAAEEASPKAEEQKPSAPGKKSPWANKFKK